MRTIKFRGRQVDNKEWVYGSYSLMEGKSKMLVDRTASNSDDWIYKEMEFEQHLICNFLIPDYQGWDYGSQCTFYKVIPSTIGQFTGLTDKNGVEIYEGDILRTWYSRDMSGMDVVVMENPVEFEIQSERSGFDIPFLHTAEIIGNIHNK